MKKQTYQSIREQRAAWILLSNELLTRALWYRDKGEPESARRLNDLAKHIRDGAAGPDAYEVIAIEFRSETAGWLKAKYAFPFEREDGPDLKAEVRRLKKLIAQGEA